MNRRKFVFDVPKGVVAAAAPSMMLGSQSAHAIWPALVRLGVFLARSRSVGRAVAPLAKNLGRGIAGTTRAGRAARMASAGFLTSSQARAMTFGLDVYDMVHMFSWIHQSVIDSAVEHKADAIWLQDAPAVGLSNDIVLQAESFDERHLGGQMVVTAQAIEQQQARANALFKTTVTVQPNKVNRYYGSVHRFRRNGVHVISGYMPGYEDTVAFGERVVVITDRSKVEFAS